MVQNVSNFLGFTTPKVCANMLVCKGGVIVFYIIGFWVLVFKCIKTCLLWIAKVYYYILYYSFKTLYKLAYATTKWSWGVGAIIRKKMYELFVLIKNKKEIG